VTHNYALVKDSFQKFFHVLSSIMAEHQRDSNSPHLVSRRPTLLRSLFTVGLLCKHFDFDSDEFGEKKVRAPNHLNGINVISLVFQVCVKDKVFDTMLYFIFTDDESVKLKALTGLGFLVVRHYEFMLSPQLKALYHDLLTDQYGSVHMRCQVLRNLQSYLKDEEDKMMKAEDECESLCVCVSLSLT
jgi:cohesin loading factor subunit SCC2